MIARPNRGKNMTKRRFREVNGGNPAPFVAP